MTNSPIIEQVSNISIFKVGKKRRRTIAKYSKNPTLSIEADTSVAEKEENEEAEKIFKKLHFPSLPFFAAFASSRIRAWFTNGTGGLTFHDHPTPLNLNTHLSLSILRI